jgi:hypothetical protein
LFRRPELTLSCSAEGREGSNTNKELTIIKLASFKLIVPQILNRLSTCYETGSVTTVFTRAAIEPYPELAIFFSTFSYCKVIFLLRYVT